MKSTVTLTYDSDHHVTASKEPQHKIIGVDCPYTGDGEEFSPANLLCVSLGSCMLLSIGYVAARNNLDLSGTDLTIKFREDPKPFPHLASMAFEFNIPHELDAVDMRRVENAASLCPIKFNIDEKTEISIKFNYGVAKAA